MVQAGRGNQKLKELQALNKQMYTIGATNLDSFLKWVVWFVLLDKYLLLENLPMGYGWTVF